MSRTAVRALVGAMLATATLLAGCSPQPGTAAVVDGERIPQSDVADAIDDLGPVLSSTDPAAMLSFLIISPVFVQVASEAGVGVSEQDGASFLDSAFEQSGQTPPATYSDAAVLLGEQAAASTNLSGLDDSSTALSTITERIAALDVEVNPRYGTFDPSSGSITAISLPWIAQG
ncbi:hypothetical protein OEB99_18770 [Actinotalea sp. M2MS4P-6]|uniref:hypothetical protein n=1 Tax=Actinotalea sp. M2MS4P-6 TaxID=2983762 RepID=UPI0021E39052|nr:hypothetical protein [Actinotalea sp. M2MS4P-6]MCV2396359.1 hypothetical protein [Actinotalea sp. M2MS4P-6]